MNDFSGEISFFTHTDNREKSWQMEETFFNNFKLFSLKWAQIEVWSELTLVYKAKKKSIPQKLDEGCKTLNS